MEARLLKIWDILGKNKYGRWIFSVLVGFFIPYSGSISSRVESLEPGNSLLILKERRPVRNHLRSVHAIALANVAELASGFAMITALPPNTRSIVTKIEIEYFKKARGVLRVKGSAKPPAEIIEKTESIALADIFDDAGELVSSTRVTWLLDKRGL